jgi:hypothetical protein
MSSDLLTLSEAKTALAQDELISDNDTILATYIGAISRRLDEVCGPIVQRTLTDELYDGGSTIWLKYKPVVSVSSVIEYDGTTATTLTQQTNSVEPSEGYVLHKERGKLTRTVSGFPAYFEGGLQNIKVTYIAGRYTNTTTVAPLFKIAAQAFLAHVWKMNQGMGSNTYGDYDGGISVVSFALPNRVKDLLGDEIEMPQIA